MIAKLNSRDFSCEEEELIFSFLKQTLKKKIVLKISKENIPAEILRVILDFFSTGGVIASPKFISDGELYQEAIDNHIEKNQRPGKSYILDNSFLSNLKEKPEFCYSEFSHFFNANLIRIKSKSYSTEFNEVKSDYHRNLLPYKNWSQSLNTVTFSGCDSLIISDRYISESSVNIRNNINEIVLKEEAIRNLKNIAKNIVDLIESFNKNRNGKLLSFKLWVFAMRTKPKPKDKYDIPDQLEKYEKILIPELKEAFKIKGINLEVRFLVSSEYPKEYRNHPRLIHPRIAIFNNLFFTSDQGYNTFDYENRKRKNNSSTFFNIHSSIEAENFITLDKNFSELKLIFSKIAAGHPDTFDFGDKISF